MFRVPWSKIYRAFPELDRFSDDECERYVLQVRVQGRGRGGPILAAAIGGLAWPLVVRLTARPLLGRWPTGDYAGVIIGAVCVAEVLAIALPLLWTRDALLIRAIRDRIDNARCASCKQSLLGLPLLAPPEGGAPGSGAEAVRCPECGSVMVLREIGLVVADLIPRREGTDTLS